MEILLWMVIVMLGLMYIAILAFCVYAEKRCTPQRLINMRKRGHRIGAFCLSVILKIPITNNTSKSAEDGEHDTTTAPRESIPLISIDEPPETSSTSV
jgi:hypothetical protein